MKIKTLDRKINEALGHQYIPVKVLEDDMAIKWWKEDHPIDKHTNISKLGMEVLDNKSDKEWE